MGTAFSAGPLVMRGTAQPWPTKTATKERAGENDGPIEQAVRAAGPLTGAVTPREVRLPATIGRLATGVHARAPADHRLHVTASAADRQVVDGALLVPLPAVDPLVARPGGEAHVMRTVADPNEPKAENAPSTRGTCAAPTGPTVNGHPTSMKTSPAPSWIGSPARRSAT